MRPVNLIPAGTVRPSGSAATPAVEVLGRSPRPRPGSAAACGIGLWICALSAMAHPVTGNPSLPHFPRFPGITWVALVGHGLLALVAAAAARWRDVEGRKGEAAAPGPREPLGRNNDPVTAGRVVW